jgi:hypothetical protein
MLDQRGNARIGVGMVHQCEDSRASSLCGLNPSSDHVVLSIDVLPVHPTGHFEAGAPLIESHAEGESCASRSRGVVKPEHIVLIGLLHPANELRRIAGKRLPRADEERLVAILREAAMRHDSYKRVIRSESKEYALAFSLRNFSKQYG